MPPPKDITVRKIRPNSSRRLSNPVLLGPPVSSPGGIAAKRASQRRNRNSIITQLSSIKHWIIDSTKRTRSPNAEKTDGVLSHSAGSASTIPQPVRDSPEGPKTRHVFTLGTKSKENYPPPKAPGLRSSHTFPSPGIPEYDPPGRVLPPVSTTEAKQPLHIKSPKPLGSAIMVRQRRRSSIASTSSLHSSRPNSRPGSRLVSGSGTSGQQIPQYAHSNGGAKPQMSMTVPSTGTNRRTSLSPSPLTPRSTNYRRHSGLSIVGSSGLRGRKSTSSSMSSIRSLHRSVSHGQAGSYAPSARSGVSQSRHSRHSSTSSRDRDSIASSVKTNPRTPKTGFGAGNGVKVLPATPTAGSFPSGLRFSRRGPGPAALSTSNGSGWQPPEYTSFSGTDRSSYAGGGGGAGGAGGSGGMFGSGGVPSPTGFIFAKRKKRPFKGPNLSSAASSSSAAAFPSAAGNLFAAHTLALVGPASNPALQSTTGSTSSSGGGLSGFGGLLMGSRKIGRGHGHGRSSSRGSNKAVPRQSGEEVIIEEEEEELEAGDGDYEIVEDDEEDEEEAERGVDEGAERFLGQDLRRPRDLGGGGGIGVGVGGPGSDVGAVEEEGMPHELDGGVGTAEHRLQLERDLRQDRLLVG